MNFVSAQIGDAIAEIETPALIVDWMHSNGRRNADACPAATASVIPWHGFWLIYGI